MLNQRMAELRKELAEMVRDVLADTTGRFGNAANLVQQCSDDNFSEAVDTVHSLVPFVHESMRPQLQKILWGIEHLYALADGFSRALSLSGSPDMVLKFEVTNRASRRTVPVAMPQLSYIFLAKDIDKEILNLKKLNKKICVNLNVARVR